MALTIVAQVEHRITNDDFSGLLPIVTPADLRNLEGNTIPGQGPAGKQHAGIAAVIGRCHAETVDTHLAVFMPHHRQLGTHQTQTTDLQGAAKQGPQDIQADLDLFQPDQGMAGLLLIKDCQAKQPDARSQPIPVGFDDIDLQRLTQQASQTMDQGFPVLSRHRQQQTRRGHQHRQQHNEGGQDQPDFLRTTANHRRITSSPRRIAPGYRALRPETSPACR